MLFMVLMEDMVLDTVLILWDMVMAILVTLLLVTALTHMESVMLRLSQRLMPMLSMAHMEFTVLDTTLTLCDMVMVILAMAVDMVLVMVVMGMESVMLSLRPMLSMVLMEDMVLDTVLILWDMVMAILATPLRPSMEPMVGMA